jgi:uncharacterized protein YecT (DUF1311 family)
MEDWSFDGIWNRREYQTFLQHVEPARNALARYFREQFGLPDARAKQGAQRVLEEVIAAWFLVPSDYERATRNSMLSESLLKFDADQVRAAIREWKERSKSKAELLEMSDALHDAVDWPTGVEMLVEAGADVNRARDAQVGYGKTPLMTAAHMNRLDTLSILLKRGADPNARTQADQGGCIAAMERDRRSALMYAAENAGPEVIALLLEAGADASAQDSKGNSVDFYLALNPRFTREDIRPGIKALVAMKRASSKGPGFDCLKASSPVEQRICQDEVLSMLDGEMTQAYGRWQRLGGSEARAEQLRWLRERNANCSAGDPAKYTGCLQQLTRARVRYMHNRIAEAGVAGG